VAAAGAHARSMFQLRAKHVVAKPRCARGKRFLVLFFKKELLSFIAFA
jgi:hypothetical protein